MTKIKAIAETNDGRTISLFSGAGGLDIGAIMPGLKFLGLMI